LSGATAIGAPTYAGLEAAFVKRMKALAGRPAGSVWVLVPTNLLALHLKRVAARALGGLAGVEFLTLQGAARRIVLPALAERGARPLPPGAAELFLKRQLDGAPPDSYFSALRRFPNGASALERAIRALEDCLWTPEALAESAAAAGRFDPGAPRRLRELASVWAALRAWKRGSGLFEDADLVREAGRPEGAPPERPEVLCVYGFYDLNPAQRSLLSRLAGSAAEGCLFALWAEQDGGPAPGFEYAAPTVEWLRDLLGAERIECPARPGARTDLERLVEGVFGERPLPPAEEARARLEREPPGFDGSVRVVSCPGEGAEATEVVREVLRAAGAWGDRPPSVGVLLRGGEGAAPLLAEAFERAGVACYLGEGPALSQTPAGRVALALLDLAVGDAERADVVDFLSLAQIDWPAGLSASALDRMARQAGVVRGRRSWLRRLRARGQRLRRDAEDVEDEADAHALSGEAALCATAVGFLEALFDALRPLASAASWADAARLLGDLTRAYAPPEDEGTGPVRELVAQLGGLDVAGVAAGAQQVRGMLLRRLGRLGLRRGRFQHSAATVSGIMDARGACFDVVIVPALVERNFPRPASPQPLLTETDREALNGMAGRHGCGPLPLQQSRPDEERCLFRIALASARRALVLTYSRLDQGMGRARMPSRFLTEACSAVAGLGLAGVLIDEGLPAGLVHRVPLNRRRWGAEDLRLALDEVEYDAAVFGGPDGGGRRTGYMAAVCENFRRALEMERVRWGQSRFGPYDGKVRAEDLIASLREKYGRFGAAVSPSRFETYARCPFEYFLRYVLGIEEVEAPVDELELSPRDRGSLLHEVLRRLYDERLKGRPLGGLSDEDAEDVLGRGIEVLDECGRLHAESHPATWDAERQRTADQLRALLRHEQQQHPDAAPAHFERDFGMAGPPPYLLPLGPGEAVSFRGRIDRIDALPDGTVQVVDYKTGKGGGLRRRSLAGGTQLQLPIYLLAACELTGAPDGSALYLMVGGPRDVPQFTRAELEERMDEFRRIVRAIVHGIAAGDFYPLPAYGARSYCERYCPFRSVCGAARSYLAQMKQGDPDADALAELRAVE